MYGEGDTKRELFAQIRALEREYEEKADEVERMKEYLAEFMFTLKGIYSAMDLMYQGLNEMMKEIQGLVVDGGN